MNETGNSEENIFSTDGTGDPNTMKVNYKSKRSQQRIGKEKNKGMKSNPFPHAEGKHDSQYSSFSVGVHTKIISGFFTTDNHSRGELFHVSGHNSTDRKYVPADRGNAWRRIVFEQENLLNNRRVRNKAILPT